MECRACGRWPQRVGRKGPDPRVSLEHADDALAGIVPDLGHRPKRPFVAFAVPLTFLGVSRARALVSRPVQNVRPISFLPVGPTLEPRAFRK
jgi:hypothetical protein